MGGSQSSPIPGGGTEGYHVLRVQPGSPGHKAGLEEFFDFIVALGNHRLNQDNETLKEVLKANVERPVKTLVYSSKSQQVRELELVPTHQWGGQGLLGVSIRFCSFEGANENVWHILDVNPGSPAAKAGLHANTDYIIGADSILHESEDLFALIDSHEGKPLKLYVYNLNSDSCREVTLTPNSAWGGEGSLGCGIGYGYLHRIPTQKERTAEEKFLRAANGSSASLMEVKVNADNIGATSHTHATPHFQASSPATFSPGNLPEPAPLPFIAGTTLPGPNPLPPNFGAGGLPPPMNISLPGMPPLSVPGLPPVAGLPPYSAAAGLQPFPAASTTLSPFNAGGATLPLFAAGGTGLPPFASGIGSIAPASSAYPGASGVPAPSYASHFAAASSPIPSFPGVSSSFAPPAPLPDFSGLSVSGAGASAAHSGVSGAGAAHAPAPPLLPASSSMQPHTDASASNGHSAATSEQAATFHPSSAAS